MNGVWWWDYCSSRKSQKCCLAKTCLNKNWVSPFPKLGIHRYPGCPISLAIHRKSRWQEELVSRFVGEEWMRAMCMYIILYNHPEVHKNMELYGISHTGFHQITSIVPRWHNPRRNMWTISGSVYCLDGSQAEEGDVQLLLEGLERLGYSLVGAREVREMAGKSRPSHGGFNLPKMVWWFQEFRGAQQALTMIGSNLERERTDGISHPPTESERSESITHHVGVSHPPPPHLGGGVTALRRASISIYIYVFSNMQHACLFQALALQMIAHWPFLLTTQHTV